MPLKNEQEVRQFLNDAYDNFRRRALTIIEIEAQKSIKKNFEVGGRPTPWKPSKKSKKHRGTKTLVVSGALSSPSAVRNDDESSVTLISNPLTRSYARIHQEGGTIYQPARLLRFRKKTYKDKSSRIVFAGAKHKRIVKATTSKPYTVVMPQRKWLVIPQEDIDHMIKLIEGKAA